MAWEQRTTIELAPPGAADYRNDGFISHAHYLLKRGRRPKGVELREAGLCQRTWQDGKEILVYSVPWSARIAFEQWVLGYSYMKPRPDLVSAPNPPLWQLRREIPDQHPLKPNYYATDCRMIDAGGTTAISTYDFAQGRQGTGYRLALAPFPPLKNGVPYPDVLQWTDVPANNPPPLAPVPVEAPVWISHDGSTNSDGEVRYEVTYEDLRAQVRTDDEIDTILAGAFSAALPNPPAIALGELGRFVQYERTWSINAIPVNRISQNSLKFVAGGNPPTPVSLVDKPVPEGGLLFVNSGQIVLRWLGVPDVPADAIDRNIGHCNVDTFGGIGDIPLFAAETLLLTTSPKTDRKDGPNLRPVHNIEFRFDYRPTGWNTFPGSTSAGTGMFPALLGGGGKTFPTGNFEFFAQVRQFAIVYQ